MKHGWLGNLYSFDGKIMSEKQMKVMNEYKLEDSPVPGFILNSRE